MPNGFKVNTWTEAASLVVLLGTLVAGLAWGMKLDSRTEQLNKESAQLRIRQDDVRERLAKLEERVDAMRHNGDAR